MRLPGGIKLSGDPQEVSGGVERFDQNRLRRSSSIAGQGSKQELFRKLVVAAGGPKGPQRAPES